MSTLGDEKNALRAELIAARRALPTAARIAAASANATHLFDLLAGSGGTVCAYLPLPSEPVDLQLLANLAASGTRVLVPVTVGAAPLDWVVFDPRLDPKEVYRPSGQPLGPEAVTTAHTVLVPALAVDRAGYRLGRGGGHYDRTLALLGPGTRVIGVIRDEELLDEAIPVDVFDLPVHAVVTPAAGCQELRASS